MGTKLTLFLTPRGDHGQSEGLRNIFGPKLEKVAGNWRKLHNDKLRDLQSSPKYYSGDHVRAIEMGGTCGTQVDKRNSQSENVKKKRPVGSPRRRWEDNIKIDL